MSVHQRARSWFVVAVVSLATSTTLSCKRGTVDPPPARSTTSPSAARTSPLQGLRARPAPPSDEGRDLRRQLVRRIETFDKPWGEGEWDPRVLEAMRQVPRHRFMPGVSLTTAYQDTAWPIGHDQTISQPSLVALMTNALKLSGREKVLEIGTGSGYQAAVLSLVSREVYSIEIVEPLARRAAERLKELGYHDVTVKVGDGYAGWPEHAPFDRIILTAAPPKMPTALVEQLVNGGIIVAPVGDENEVQELERWTKQGNDLAKEKLGGVRFVPMVPGEKKK